MTASNNSLPIAIVAGCGLIALGLYFGLRARPDGAAREAPASQAAQVVADRKGTEADVARALDEQRVLFRDKCWTPALAKSKTPTESTYTFEIGVDLTGNEVARGVNVTPGAREDVADCLRMVIAPVKVAPPGRALTVRVPVKLP